MSHNPHPAPGAEREFHLEDNKRRWVSGFGGGLPAHPAVQTLLEHGHAHRRRWSTAGNVTGSELDQLQTEQLLWRLVDAGLVRVHQRRDRRGNWECYEWMLTERGEEKVEETVEDERVAPGDYLAAGADDQSHPLLSRIRDWLLAGHAPDSPRIARILMALGRQLRRGHRPTGRAISIDVAGSSKQVELENHRETLEYILDCRLEDVFHIRGSNVLAWGPFAFDIRGQHITGDWSVPYLALTADTLENLENLQSHADRIVTIENLAAFEPFVREERPEDTVVVFTSGFAGSLVLDFLHALLDVGATSVTHWGDLDVGGLRILRHLDETLPVPVRPMRMEPELLERLPDRPLTDEDRRALHQWLDEPDAPYRRLADALLNAGMKIEQEAWYVVGGAY